MMRFPKFLVALAWVAFLGAPAGATTATYTFNHSGNLPNPPWTLQDGTIMSESGGSLQSVNFTAYNTAPWNSNTFGAAQYSEMTLGAGVSGFVSLIVRANGTNNYYMIYYESGNLTLERNVANSHTIVFTFSMSAWSSGDVIRMEISSGYDFTFKRSGTTLTTFTDSGTPAALATGQPGVASYSGISGVTVWSGGDLGGGGGPVTPTFRSSLLGVGF